MPLATTTSSDAPVSVAAGRQDQYLPARQRQHERSSAGRGGCERSSQVRSIEFVQRVAGAGEQDVAADQQYCADIVRILTRRKIGSRGPCSGNRGARAR